MKNLNLDRREGNTLYFIANDGTKFSVSVDQRLMMEVRAAMRNIVEHKPVRPSEIQKLLRSGNTQQEVAQITGASIEDIERYALPVLAELDFILRSARSVPVHTGNRDADFNEEFGEVIDTRLREIAAHNTIWKTHKDEERQWIVTVEFTTNDNERSAQWIYEQKKNTLTPHNPDALELSKQGSVGDSLIPRLRVLPQDIPAPPAPPVELPEPVPTPEPTPAPKEVSTPETSKTLTSQAIRTAETPQDLGETQDLLDQLRKRRSEREAEAATQEPEAQVTPLLEQPDSTAPTEEAKPSAGRADLWANLTRISSSEASSETKPTPEPEMELPPVPEPDKTDTAKANKRGRSAIPSWDDILFGTRGDEE